MPTRNVVVTEHQANLIETLVKSGKYQNASEVLREGLRMVEFREKAEAAKLKALRSAIDEGIAASERGDSVTFDDPKRLNAYLTEVGEAAITKASKR